MALLVVMVGLVSGMLSSIFGIGGGFIATPFLIALGVPPHIATACATHQIVGSSFMGVLTKIKPLAMDVKLAFVLAFFGIGGSFFGMQLVERFQKFGLADVLISLFYVVVMFYTVVNIFVREVRARRDVKKMEKLELLHKMPWRVKFVGSQKEISLVFLALVGFVVGILTGVMGIGGGFVMVPLMTYTLKIQKDKIIGTSLAQILIITLFVTILNVFVSQSVDLLLGIFLILGGVCGSFVGSVVARIIVFEKINFLLALLILCVSFFFISDLVGKPKQHEMFVLEEEKPKF